MKVWVGYYCSHNFCDVWKVAEKVFDDEVKALLWAEDKAFLDVCQVWDDGTVMEWREYEEFEVE